MGIDLSKVKHIHFIGIGGVSMSGLAEILMNKGYKITGSDMKKSERTDKLTELGAKVYINHSSQNIKNPDLVVYTVAVNGSNPELIAARGLGIPVIDRAELLGYMMKSYKHSIAIAGTHGKTTTTSMISLIMLQAGMDPTIHIGAEFNQIGGSTRVGQNQFFITEACEYYDSFLKFYPHTAVILNVEADHLDYFKDINHVKEAFGKFIQLVPDNGNVIACIDDKNTAEILHNATCKLITYGIHSETADWIAKDITYDKKGFPEFTAVFQNSELGRIKLNVPGLHNVYNALAAAAACYCSGCDFNNIKKSLSGYKGSHHRFEIKGEVKGITVIDDYAHHPSEIKATLEAASNCDYKRIWCVFQPHTYTRTKLLFKDFVNSFDRAYCTIISDIYAAREADPGDINSAMLANEMKQNGSNAEYMSDFRQISDYLKSHVSDGDLVITMGAGDISIVGDMFLS